MSGAVLTEDIILKCSHGGDFKAIPTQQTLKIGGKAALLKTDTFVPGGTPCPLSSSPCVSITFASAQGSANLKVNGIPVLTQSDIASGKCMPSSTPPIGVPTQVNLTA